MNEKVITIAFSNMCLHIDDFMNQDEHVSSDLTSNIHIWLLALEQVKFYSQRGYLFSS